MRHVVLETWWQVSTGKLIQAAVVLLAAALVRGLAVLAVRKSIDGMVQRTQARLEAQTTRRTIVPAAWTSARQLARTRTLGSMLSSTITVVVVTIAALTLMSIFGVPMGPLLTSAGVGGVALAFGAQSLVKDYLTGIFLIAEDQFGVGDVVTLGAVTGTVEEVTLRVTRVRDGNGQVWYVRNGEIVTVGNTSQGYSNALVDVAVHYTAQAEAVIAIVQSVVDEFDADETWSKHLLEKPTVLGVESIQGETMTIRVAAKCLPNEQWGVQRELRERSKRALDEAGIRGPGLAWPRH